MQYVCSHFCLSILLASLLVPNSSGFAANVSIAWDPSPDSNIISYSVYYGPQSKTYTNLAIMGNATSGTLSNLVSGATYYFAATATANSALESGFSEEISYLVPLPVALPSVSIAVTDATAGEPGTGLGNGIFVLTRTGSTAQPLTVGFSVGGTANPGSDFASLGSTAAFVAGSRTATVTVSVLDDGLIEPSETVVLALTPGSRYQIASPSSATVTISDDDCLTLAAALDTPGWTWTTGGNTPSWYPQTSLTHDGSDCARSGAIGSNETNWIQTLVTGPGTLTFWWKVSTETNCDYAHFYVNGAELARRSGEADWSQARISLGSGPQRLRWDYARDAAGSMGQNALWLDQVSFVSSVAPTSPAPAGAPNAPTAPGELRLVLRAGADGSVSLQWPTESGRTYAFETAPDVSGPWAEVFTIIGDGTVQQWKGNQDQPNAVFRVRADPLQ